jgi:hypothetical protein
MSQFRISGKPEDWTNWEKLIEDCGAYNELTRIEKNKARCALIFLKHEFGEEFLVKALEGFHPIMYYFVNSAPWTRRWLTRFADALKTLMTKEGYPSLLERLKDKAGFFEGESVLEVAYKLSKAGFRVSIDPLTSVNGKVPDLKLTNEETGEELFVEVSVQQQSLNHAKAIRTFDEFFNQLSPFHGLTYCGRIFKILSERHMAEVVEMVRNKIDVAKKENSFQELIIEKTIELGIAPYKDNDVLAEWAKSRGLELGRFTGPPFNVDEIPRTRMKIEREQLQLPQNSPNILVIENNDLFRSARDIRREISELEECLYDFSNLLCFIGIGLLEGYDGTIQDKLVKKDQHIIVKRLREDSIIEQCMILRNRFCDFEVTSATINKIYLAFSKC